MSREASAISETEKVKLLFELESLMSRGLTQADILRYLGEQVPASLYGPYIAAARVYVEEELADDWEVDDLPLVRRGGDAGVWVNTWLWYYDREVLGDGDAEGS